MRNDDESLRELAEQEMRDKRGEVGSEEQVSELYDLPAETAGDLAREQASGRREQQD